jgi:hypothetical protein
MQKAFRTTNYLFIRCGFHDPTLVRLVVILMRAARSAKFVMRPDEKKPGKAALRGEAVFSWFFRVLGCFKALRL